MQVNEQCNAERQLSDTRHRSRQAA